MKTIEFAKEYLARCGEPGGKIVIGECIEEMENLAYRVKELEAELRRLQQELADVNEYSVLVNDAQLKAEASYQDEIEQLKTALANERQRCAEIARKARVSLDVERNARIMEAIAAAIMEGE